MAATHWELLSKHQAEIEMMKTQRIEDRKADKLAHEAILLAVNEVKDEVKNLSKKYASKWVERVVKWVVWFILLWVFWALLNLILINQ